MTYKLLGADVSYYSGKARAYLRYKRIPFEEILATREVYTQEIIPRVGWPVIPVVVTPDNDTLQDTTSIIDALDNRFPEPSVYPQGPRQKLVAILLEAYGDEWLKIPAMHYRWNHCFEWTLREFGKLSAPGLSPEEQLEIGRKNAGRFHGSLPFLGVHPETSDAIEISYEEFLQDFNRHLEEHAFLFGSKPSIGDFGLFGPLYAHLYRDPYPGELMRAEAPNVARWVETMRDGAGQDGKFVDDDQLPETLWPILERWADEYVPVLVSTAEHFRRWADGNLAPDSEFVQLPRAIGNHSFSLLKGDDAEVSAERAIFPYDLWMLQRAQDHFSSLSGDDDASNACRKILTTVGAGEIADLEFPRLEIVDYRLVARAP